MAGIKQFLKRKDTVECDEIVCRKQMKNELPTSSMSCHDIADTVGDVGKQILTDSSYFKTGWMKQSKLSSYPKSCEGGDMFSMCLVPTTISMVGIFTNWRRDF